MSQPTIHHAPDLSDEEIDRMLDAMADSFGQQLRSPIIAFTVGAAPRLPGRDLPVAGRRAA
jgi:hypothetical protein